MHGGYFPYENDSNPLPGKIKCCCKRRAIREKEERVARLQASRKMVRRERKNRDLGRVSFFNPTNEDQFKTLKIVTK